MNFRTLFSYKKYHQNTVEFVNFLFSDNVNPCIITTIMSSYYNIYFIAPRMYGVIYLNLYNGI